MTRRLGDERGQILPLALAFMVFFSLVITGLLTYANASVLTTERLREQRNTVYAADGATDGAIQYARLNPSAGAFGASPCITYSANLDGVTAAVSCTSLAGPTDVNRTVKFTTSVGGTPMVVAFVTYHDGAPGTPVDVTSWTYCGHGTPC